MSIDTVVVLVVMGGLALLVADARAGAARERQVRLAREHRLEIVPDEDRPEDRKENLG